MKRIIQWIINTLILLSLFACAPMEPQPKVTVGSPKSISLKIDARDYNEIAKKIYDSLSRSGRVEKEGVAALGPVQLNLDGNYHFNTDLLQEKIQVHAHRGNIMNFTYAIDASTGDSAILERYKIMQLQWEKEASWDSEELRVWGGLANIDYLLFGKLTTQTTNYSGGKEVTYTYNWKLGNCENGLLVWTDEIEITKSTSR